MTFDEVSWCEVALAAFGWRAVATYATRSGPAAPSITQATRGHVSRLTTRFVNALETHHHIRLFHVVSGVRT